MRLDVLLGIGGDGRGLIPIHIGPSNALRGSDSGSGFETITIQYRQRQLRRFSGIVELNRHELSAKPLGVPRTKSTTWSALSVV
jgi:hypothetical protein